ncbi:Siderophore iron transporter [Colletotrichum higginsianum IMI 349063]|uniref:Siderophore iron transporter n=2 Tax=Colletotrichum higginsianum TaxID=80884 RepID=A0A1B7YCV6_COLHI|nr:Siderophore iron transporter [Colletotrichum higginsianum IMI 349063]OBR09764.1 Siderophore iron transporter [Colletotrichum higginsianum IMI 349063]TID07238.1 Siderophore iron transporter 3 [Colletotrichum higginsianum]
MNSNTKETGVFSDDTHLPRDGTISPSTDREEVPISSVGEVLQSQGVTRMEAVYREAKQSRLSFYLVGVSVLVCAWAYSLDGSTTSYYSIDASSHYKQHSSVLSTLSIATGIISAVSKPFVAKVSDVTSRPYTYIVTLLFYVVGYVVAASSASISAYVAGEVLVAVGSSGLDLTNDIIVADLTPLEWRGFVSSLLSTPFIINTWFAGKIVDAVQARDQWRWGYGMFAIIMPAALGPAIATLLYLDRKARNEGVVNLASSNAARRAAEELAEEKGYDGPRGAIVAPAPPEPSAAWTESLKRSLVEIDAFGLVLLGFGWTLLLLPFSLKTYADHGWRNRSLIAMMVVGGVLLVAYVVYEMKWAKVPSAPRRLVMNKTFLMAIVIDSFYMLAGNMRGLYWSSYVYIAKPWSSQDWVYYNNTLTLALCVFGLVAGLLQRWTHRYKMLQIIGLCIKIIGMGIMIDGPRATISTAPMVLSLVMIGCGGAFSVVGSRVASQASVPHQDVALAIALLSLWSKIGSSVGSAVVAVIWADRMPKLLRRHLPASATDKDVQSLFNSVRAIRTKFAFDDPMRQGAIEAYRRTLYYCLVPALALAFVPLVAALFQTNFYLGKQHNAVTNVGNDGLVLREEDRNPEPLPPARNKKEAFLRFWAGRK